MRRQLQRGNRIPAASADCLVLTLLLILQISLPAGRAAAQGCGLCELAERIDREELTVTVRELSGTDPVTIGGISRHIWTRSSLLPEKLIAREYLLERVAEMGYDAVRQAHTLSVYYPDLMAAEVSVTGESLWTGSDEGEVFLMTAAEDWNDARVISNIDARIFGLSLDSFGTLWAACKTKGSGHGELHFSADRGETWQAKVIGNTQNNILALNSIVFSSPTAAIVSGARGTAFRMRYYEGDWYIYYFDPSDFSYAQLNGSASSGPMNVWIVSDGGTIFGSDNLGADWTATAPSPRTLRDVDFYGPERGIAVGDGLTCHTVDGGGTWNVVSVNAYFHTVIMLDTLSAVAAGGYGQVWTTVDGGVTWSRLAFDCPRDEDILTSVLSPSGAIWAVGRNMPLRLETGGPETECRQWEMADTIWGENIIFGSTGRDFPDERVILCAHYDSRNWQDPYCAPGADDNASGCAGVLEIARIFAGATFERSIEYVLFDGEEIGLIGSRYYVAQRDTGLTVSSVINLDMIGRDYGGGVTVQVAGREDPLDSALAASIAEVADYLQLDLDCEYLFTSSPLSDHIPFWDIEGVPSVLLIENEYYDNPHYHACSDVAAYIDFDFMTDVVRAAAGSAARLAGLISADPLPSSVVLHQNFPNPLFNHTRIRFELPSRLSVDLSLFDLAGRKVAWMIRDTLDEGRHEYAWNGRDRSGAAVASGVYFLRLRAGAAERVRKVVIVR